MLGSRYCTELVLMEEAKVILYGLDVGSCPPPTRCQEVNELGQCVHSLRVFKPTTCLILAERNANDYIAGSWVGAPFNAAEYNHTMTPSTSLLVKP